MSSDSTSLPCINTKHGCPWFGPAEDLILHLDSCTFRRQVRCMMAGCDVVLPYNKMTLHIMEKHVYHLPTGASPAAAALPEPSSFPAPQEEPSL